MSALSERHRISRQLRALDPTRPAGRKTAVKVEHRRASHEMPDWRLRFALPAAFGFGFVPGPVLGVVGVHIVQDAGRGLYVEIVGKNAQWICDRVAAFIRKHAKGRPGMRISATMARDGEPNATPSAPGRAGERRAGEIIFVTGNPAVVIDGFAMHTLFFEG